jgi:hypothetical protein
MMSLLKPLALPLACAATILAGGAALAQTTPPPHKQLEQTIGQAQPEIVPSLIVLNARSAALDGTSLTLSGTAGSAIIFADRPVRAAGHSPTPALISEWDEGSDSFAADPPNATVSVFDEGGNSIGDIVVTLKSPTMTGDTLVFQVDLYRLSGPAAVFIDIIGRPLTPASYAGVARRTTARAAMYAGAAVDAEAARQACGYPPYPPCN